MAISREAIHTHRERYGVMYLISGIGSFLPIITLGALLLNGIGNIATEDELTLAISMHNDMSMHPAAAAAVGGVQDQLNSIEAYQIESRIESQLKLVCENGELRNALEPTIKQLIRDYNSLMPDNKYVRPPCIQLGVLE